MSPHLQHDCAWACASALADLVDPLLNEEQRREYFAASYRAVKAAIDAYCIQQNREAARLCKPQPN